jgi:hypothetical protein
VVRCSGIRQIIAINPGQHHIFKAHRRHDVAHFVGLLLIEPAARIAGVYCTETAGSRTDGAHQHDSGSTGIPTLFDVGVLRLFACGGEPVSRTVRRAKSKPCHRNRRP